MYSEFSEKMHINKVPNFCHDDVANAANDGTAKFAYFKADHESEEVQCLPVILVQRQLNIVRSADAANDPRR